MIKDTISDHHYKVLGVTRGEPLANVKKKLSREFNNDSSLLMPKEESTHNRYRELIDAYEFIKKDYDKVEISDSLSNDSNELAKILGFSLPLLKLKYNVFIIRNPEENLSFIGWLRQEVRIKKLCEELDRTRESLNKDYKHYRAFYKQLPRISFVEWLEMELEIITICKSVGKSKLELFSEYQKTLMSLNNPYMTFQSWLLKYQHDFMNNQYKKI